MCKCTPEIRTPFCGKPGCENPDWLPHADAVNHPPHYNIGKIEVIEAIEDWKLEYHLGNAVKYIARAGRKNPEKITEDLEKANWYLRRFVEIQKDSPRRPNDMAQDCV